MRGVVPFLVAAASACGASPAPTPGDVVVVPVVGSAAPTATTEPRALPPPVTPQVIATSLPLAAAMRRELLASCASSAEMDATMFREANDLETAGDLSGARKTYYEIIVKVPTSPLIPYVYVAFADLFFDEAEKDSPDKWAIASQAYQKVVGSPPPGNLAYAYAWSRLGVVYVHTGDFAKGLDASQKAIRATLLYPTLPLPTEVATAARHTMVEAYAMAGAPDRAVSFFRSVDPPMASATVVALGVEYARRGNLRDAAALYDSALTARDETLCAGAAALKSTPASGPVSIVALTQIEAKRRAVCGP